MLPENHPATGMAWYNLHTSYEKVGVYPRALECAKEALRIWQVSRPSQSRRHLGCSKSHSQIVDLRSDNGDIVDMSAHNFAVTLNSLAASYRSFGATCGCFGYMFEQLLAFQRRVLSADHPDIVDSMINVAVSYHNVGRHAEASDLQKQVILFRPPNFSR